MNSFVISAIILGVMTGYYIIATILKFILCDRFQDNKNLVHHLPIMLALILIFLDLIDLATFIYICIRFAWAGAHSLASGILIALYVFFSLIYWVFCFEFILYGYYYYLFLVCFDKIAPKRFRHWAIGYQPLYNQKVAAAAKSKTAQDSNQN